MIRRIVGPFNRVEGDLEVQLEIKDDVVKDAWVVSPMYRGFEQILHGKDPRDALIYTPRICGICSVSQSIAAALALADAMEAEVPINGQLANALIHACENVADHFTHFNLFFMPDFCREPYSEQPWYEAVKRRFKATRGSAATEAVKARAELLHMMGILAGKWPHSLTIQPSGSSRPVSAKERVRLLLILANFREYLQQQFFGDSLEAILAIENSQQLDSWMSQASYESSDFRLFLHIADSLELDQLGRFDNAFMSYGVYRVDGRSLLQRGVWQGGAVHALDTNTIAEDISHSWMEGQSGAQHPYQGVTLPNIDNEKGYTWCKAPRLGGEVVEVGAFARQLVNGNALISDLFEKDGCSNVRSRVIARLIEIAQITVAMEQWCRDLSPKEPFFRDFDMNRSAEGAGLTEAARGSLGHWVRVKNGRILNYQIVAPTTWNFSPRDSSKVSGALEQALIGTPVLEGEKDPVAVQHIVRSFDPCMVCTVH